MEALTLLWVLLGVAVATLVVSLGLVVGGRRGRGGSAADGSTLTSGSSTAVDGAPAPSARDAGSSADGDADAVSAGDTLTLDRPDPVAGRMQRLRSRLSRSQNAFGLGLLALLSRGAVDDSAWEEIEDLLITADVGVTESQALVERLRTRVKVDGITEPDALRSLLRDELVALVDPTLDRSLAVDRVGDHPAVVLMVGVNGTGKTTTTGKLARVLVAQDKDVLLGAADTFRAAASAQLTTWGDRVGVPTIARGEGADPASVAFDAVSAGVEHEVDVVLIDTAGRLHTKTGLMDELGKVRRVIEKKAPVTEVLLVLDATTGQNGLAQGKVFTEAVAVTGLVLTKLDGTAKGGIVLAVQRELGIPVKLVGLGEGPDDLAPFDVDIFVEALLGGDSPNQ